MRSFESIKIIVKKKKKRKEIFHMFSSISVCSSVLGFWPRIKRAMQIYVERVKCQLGRGSLPICISIRLLNARTTRLRYRSRYRILFRRREERERREGKILVYYFFFDTERERRYFSSTKYWEKNAHTI